MKQIEFSSEETDSDHQRTRSDSERSLVEEEGRCGYGKCEPRFLQCCNNAKGFLAVYVGLVVVQGMLVNGFVNVSISTLEKRFGFTSSETGVMAISYDIAFCCITLFVTYFGARSHRPRMVGIGAFVLGLGAMIFWLPHFTTEKYQYSADGFEETCTDENINCNTGASSNLSNYIWVFIAAQLLHGFGCTPLYTLGLAYIEDSVPKESASVYLGIGNAATVLGPGIGYGLGGLLLEIYVDFYAVDTSNLDITSSDPRWVGAWWLGMMFAMVCAFLLCIPLFGFPKVLPETARYRTQESEVPTDIVQEENFGKSYKDFPLALLTLLKNRPFVLCSLASCTEAMVISGFSTFLPKIIENEFRQTAGTAAIVAGVIGIPGGVIGHLLAGLLVNRFKMKTENIYKFNVLYCVLVCATAPSLFLYCPNNEVAGLTISYSENSAFNGSLLSDCNTDCYCQEEYYIPVCGADNINYFTACHAGCSRSDEINDTTYFYDCPCINGSNPESWHAVEGICETECNSLSIFLGVFFFSVLFNCMSITPALVATFRVVPPGMKTFALGVQWLLIRALGTIPGPILFGTIIDLTCIFWQTRQCDGTQGSCWIYDAGQMAINVFSITVGCKVVSALLFFSAFWVYKPPKDNTEENKLKEDITELNEAFTTEPEELQAKENGVPEFELKHMDDSNHASTNTRLSKTTDKITKL